VGVIPGKAYILMIREALTRADTRHTLYFLLTSYVDTLALSKGIPEKVRSLPIQGEADVVARAAAMHDVLEALAPDQRAVAPVLLEVAEVFDVASEQLQKLERLTDRVTPIDVIRGRQKVE
jgi:hypothetical protein